MGVLLLHFGDQVFSVVVDMDGSCACRVIAAVGAAVPVRGKGDCKVHGKVEFNHPGPVPGTTGEAHK